MPQWNSERWCHRQPKWRSLKLQVSAEVPPSELTSICMTGRRHHRAQLSPLQVVMHLVSLMHTGGVSCHHLHPSMNNVWTRETKHFNTQQHMKAIGLFLYICYLRFSYIRTTPKGALWFFFFTDLWIWAEPTFSAPLSCSTHAAYNPHPLSTSPCHFFFLLRVHGRVHGSPICHDIWWTRHALRASGPV